jgi:two-component system response regulator AtoC
MHHVLLVDDEPSILTALERLVRKRGWEPLVAHSGLEALGVASRADAIVTDLSMPGMDGLELLRVIRERDDTVPVILVTAQEHFAAQARRAGAYDFLTKPFDVEQLSMAIDRALEARRLRMENRQLRASPATAQRAVAAVSAG